MRVLVVDDSPAPRRRVAAMIREAERSAFVAEARSAAEAISMAGQVDAHLVVLDLGLPDRGGLELIEPLKRASNPPVIVVLTNHATEHHRRESLARGADYFFDKSLEFERVSDVVRRVLSTLDA